MTFRKKLGLDSKMKGKVIHVIFLPQRRQQNVEKYQAKMAKAGNGGISAYNAGVNTAQTYDNMDIGKTHNYANDVDARARFYKKNGY